VFFAFIDKDLYRLWFGKLTTNEGLNGSSLIKAGLWSWRKITEYFRTIGNGLFLLKHFEQMDFTLQIILC